MNNSDLQRAADGNPELYRVLDDLTSRVSGVEDSTTPPSGIPPVCQYSVVGQDGTVVVDITLPENKDFSSPAQRILQQKEGDSNTFGATIFHQLQSSLTRNFDANGDVRSYGPDSKVHFEVGDTPDQSRYWRLRSSYDRDTWNRWVEYSDPLVCGVVPIDSGQVRSVRIVPNGQLNVTNFATVDSVVNGGNADIRVYGPGGVGTTWTRQVGESIEGPFPSATLAGYVFSSDYVVVYDKKFLMYRVFTKAEYSKRLPDRYRWVGAIHTVDGGGAGGVGGGGGTGGGSGGCVEVGVPVEFYAGSECSEIVEPCSEWVVLEFPGETPIPMHPKTLVAVFLQAAELTGHERIEVGTMGDWRRDGSTRYEHRESFKVVRRVFPDGVYMAGSARVRLHNNKSLEA